MTALTYTCTKDLWQDALYAENFATRVAIQKYLTKNLVSITELMSLPSEFYYSVTENIVKSLDKDHILEALEQEIRLNLLIELGSFTYELPSEEVIKLLESLNSSEQYVKVVNSLIHPSNFDSQIATILEQDIWVQDILVAESTARCLLTNGVALSSAIYIRCLVFDISEKNVQSYGNPYKQKYWSYWKSELENNTYVLARSALLYDPHKAFELLIRNKESLSQNTLIWFLKWAFDVSFIDSLALCKWCLLNGKSEVQEVTKTLLLANPEAKTLVDKET